MKKKVKASPFKPSLLAPGEHIRVAPLHQPKPLKSIDEISRARRGDNDLFSGQAPARVLETVARPRNAFALTGIYGEGRILLAACATNESAWEQPGTGHGLLTHAVIEAWTGTAGDSVSFPEIVGEIIRLARRYKFVTPYTSFLAAPRALLRNR